MKYQDVQHHNNYILVFLYTTAIFSIILWCLVPRWYRYSQIPQHVLHFDVHISITAHVHLY